MFRPLRDEETEGFATYRNVGIPTGLRQMVYVGPKRTSEREKFVGKAHNFVLAPFSSVEIL
jgi:hypothetical protein